MFVRVKKVGPYQYLELPRFRGQVRAFVVW